jgi:hypothetical protein
LALAHAGILHSGYGKMQNNNMGEGQNVPASTGGLSIPKLQFSRGELHFLLAFVTGRCISTVYTPFSFHY